MSCPCYSVTFTREPVGFSFAVNFTREVGEVFDILFERTCEEVVDLVPFSACDGHFFTSEGYTILVKK